MSRNLACTLSIFFLTRAYATRYLSSIRRPRNILVTYLHVCVCFSRIWIDAPRLMILEWSSKKRKLKWNATYPQRQLQSCRSVDHIKKETWGATSLNDSETLSWYLPFTALLSVFTTGVYLSSRVSEIIANLVSIFYFAITGRIISSSKNLLSMSWKFRTRK